MKLPIDPWIFLISFAIGILIVYISTPLPDVIVEYPTLENAGRVVYRDDANVCYRYEPRPVDCPTDQSKIFEIPLQVHDPETKNGESAFKQIWGRIEEISGKNLQN